MEKDQFFEIGHISRVHGNDGKVYVKLDVDDPNEYLEMESVFFDLENKPVPFFIEYLRVTPSGLLVKFEDINDREEAERFSGTSLLMPTEILPKLKGEKFYYHELINAELHDRKNGRLGIIELIYDQTSQLLLGVDNNGREVLVPLVDEFNPYFDKENNRLEMDLPDGLLDLNQGIDNAH